MPDGPLEYSWCLTGAIRQSVVPKQPLVCVYGDIFFRFLIQWKLRIGVAQVQFREIVSLLSFVLQRSSNVGIGYCSNWESRFAVNL